MSSNTFVGLCAKLSKRLPQRLWWALAKRQLGACGENVRLPKDGMYLLKNIYIGNDVRFGVRPFLWAVNSRIYIGDKVGVGPSAIIVTGNHNIELGEKFMFDLTDKEKRPDDDQDVVFEGDIQIGARVTILKGVRIGRGAVVGAGSVVTKAVPRYCVVAGSPAKLLRLRGSIDEILAYETRLYPKEKRMTQGQLVALLGNCINGNRESFIGDMCSHYSP